MEATPFVSFCFSTYKRPSYLRSTLDSIFKQTCGDYEVIVSDNDTGESGRIAVESVGDPRFKYFPNGENLGMKKSYNKSLERSVGKFIVMIADDDPVYPDMLETLVRLQEDFPGYGMYMGGCDWFCTSQALGKLYRFNVGTNSCLSNNHDLGFTQSYSGAEFLKKLYSFNIFPHYLWSTCMVRREALLKTGGVPEYGTPFLGDYAYLSAVGTDSGCVVINKSLGCQTLHEENFGRKEHDQIVTAAKNFPVYIEERASHLEEWQAIKPLMLRFVGLWVVSHLSFLYSYSHLKNQSLDEIRDVEANIFKIDYLRRYKLKYWLKTRIPWLHNMLVNLKQRLNRK